ncbi:hypothetical protein AEAC466_19245 [Asticcacaulis sp. AC466]|nr:hypothetical protein AEAC466_19245 [Asticcacaulis sp. AC466]
MADAGNNLRIKFGLAANPSLALQRRWADRVEELVRLGFRIDQAGEGAAKELFSDYRTRAYASAGDTIEFLLRQVKDK